MTSSCVVWSLAPFALLALEGRAWAETAGAGGCDRGIEQALIEHTCSLAQPPGTSDQAHEECLSTQLTSLRGDFGRDLQRLSNGERRGLDTACSRMRAAEGREAYIACLSANLDRCALAEADWRFRARTRQSRRQD